MMYDKIRNRLLCIWSKLQGASMGSNCYLGKNLDITHINRLEMKSKSKLYKNSTFYIGSKGTFSIGENSHVAPNAYALIGDNDLIIGNHVAIGPNCSFINHSNHYEGSSNLFCENYLDDRIVLGDNVFVGAQCVFLPGVVVENNVVIASNTVVKGNLKSGYIYGGTPCKPIKPI